MLSQLKSFSSELFLCFFKVLKIIFALIWKIKNSGFKFAIIIEISAEILKLHFIPKFNVDHPQTQLQIVGLIFCAIWFHFWVHSTNRKPSDDEKNKQNSGITDCQQ